MIRFLLIIMGLFLLLRCGGSAPGERLLFDFESDAELDRFNWRCYTLSSLSNEHATYGEKSLKLELYPSDYPGLTPILEENDWRDYQTLRFDIFNPQKESLTITVRIDDRRDYPDYEDRYNKGFILKPGMNHIRILLDALITSGLNRKLKLKRISRVFIFMTRPERRQVLYVDYIRLVS